MTINQRIETAELREYAESRVKSGANAMYLHAADLIALLDELDSLNSGYLLEIERMKSAIHASISNGLREENERLMEQSKTAEDDAAHWKANHDNQVQRAMILTQRPDMPIERVAAYSRMLTLEAAVTQLNSELDEWRKLKDPNALHINLLAGKPAKLNSDQILHIAGYMATCTCPSGDGSLRWPCPTHPPEACA